MQLLPLKRALYKSDLKCNFALTKRKHRVFDEEFNLTIIIIIKIITYE